MKPACRRVISRPIENGTVETAHREHCYCCFRPKGHCLCAAIPNIENKTSVLILQHMRERFHPFNTARIVHRALRNSVLLADHTRNLASRSLPIHSRAGLLYPGPQATLLSDLPSDQFPPQLVIVDGTWHQAKTLVRDIPALRDLPRYGLAPELPSRYRLRREPTAVSLSTLEATVSALRMLEPETDGCEQLIAAFNGMVERQLAHAEAAVGPRRVQRRSRTPLNIPLALIRDLEHVVVAYGESAAGEKGCRRGPRLPVYWVAQRCDTGERFSCAIQPTAPLSETFLGHLELRASDFSAALTLAEFRAAWRDFRRPNDLLAVYSRGTAQLLTDIGADMDGCLVLKSVKFHHDRRDRALDELLSDLRIPVRAPEHRGRAGKRLANAMALVRHLHVLAKDSDVNERSPCESRSDSPT